jgi:hypothetical protein
MRPQFNYTEEKTSDDTNLNSATGKEWPKYTRNLIVKALRIAAVQTKDDGSATLHFQNRADYPPVDLTTQEVADHMPKGGDWLVLEPSGLRHVLEHSVFVAVHRQFG